MHHGLALPSRAVRVAGVARAYLNGGHVAEALAVIEIHVAILPGCTEAGLRAVRLMESGAAVQFEDAIRLLGELLV